MNKYDNWIVEVLHITKDKDIANLLEIEEIRHYNCVIPNGYNLTRGGDGGDTLTNNPNREIAREKNRVARKGDRNAKGTRHTKEFCELQSKKIQGNRNPSKNPITVLKQQRTKLLNKLAKLE